MTSSIEKAMLSRLGTKNCPQDALDYEWETDEAEPRAVALKGRSRMDPDVAVIEIDGKALWVMACGSTFDGQIIDGNASTDVYIRRKGSIAWECFSDVGYFDMWCVRKLGEREFGQGYHLVNEREARDLCALLNDQTAATLAIGKTPVLPDMDEGPMSRCNQCGERYPRARPGAIHKCGRCSGGMCSPED